MKSFEYGIVRKRTNILISTWDGVGAFGGMSTVYTFVLLISQAGKQQQKQEKYTRNFTREIMMPICLTSNTFPNDPVVQAIVRLIAFDL